MWFTADEVSKLIHPAYLMQVNFSIFNKNYLR